VLSGLAPIGNGSTFWVIGMYCQMITIKLLENDAVDYLKLQLGMEKTQPGRLFLQ
jgi:hypothetical protein